VIGVVRVITSDDPEFTGAHGRWIEQRYGVPTLSRCIPGQPHGVHDEATEARAVPKIVEVARGLVADGATCVLISCAADPALAETRTALPGVPVVGAGSSGAAVAGTVHALGSRLAASVRPEGVHRTTDLLEPGAAERSLDAARRLVDAGAGVILFACTGMTTIGLAAPVRAELGVPVVDAVLAAGLTASYALPHSA
jgi:Asp/Glu/hydantoin racemase